MRSASKRAPRALKFIDTPVPPGVSLADETLDPEEIRNIASKRNRNASSTAPNAFELKLGSIGEIEDMPRFRSKRAETQFFR